MNGQKNAICSPIGFRASGIACGLKKSGRLDLGLIYSIAPAIAYGMFTKNKFAAAPVIVTKKHLKARKAQAVIVNSGNANCFTGPKGLAVANLTTKAIAKLLGLKDNEVLVGSTGIIGKKLDFDKIRKALGSLINSLSEKNGHKFALSIMTTDTRPKELVVRFKIEGRTVTIGGTAKGAGMIAPDMATLLTFITTDAAIEYRALKRALGCAVNDSFNNITIDGCMSTNDSVVILANGLAKNRIITVGSKSFFAFSKALKEICLGLSKMIVRDAEGATKFITIKVSGALNNKQAKKAALQIANSDLFKTALYGQNPNMGRVVAAVGASGVKVKEGLLGVIYSPLKNKNVELCVDLKVGKGSTTVYTSDLTPEYIKINAEYN